MEARNKSRILSGSGRLAIETVLVLAALALLLATAVKRMGGTDATVVAGTVHSTSVQGSTSR